MAGDSIEATGAPADLRAQIIAEMSSAKPEAPVEATEAAPVEDAPVEEVEAAADAAGPDEDSPEVEADDLEDTDDDEDTSLKSDDPETQKRLDAVRRAEKRMREKASQRDAEFEARQKEWQAKVDRVAEIETLAKRAKYDPAAVLRAFGLTDDDMEIAAHAIFAESPAAQKDPNRKAAAQSRLREREKEDKLSATEKRLQELEQRLETQAAQQRAQAEAAAYIEQLNATSAKYPLVAHLLKVDTNDTHDQLVATYNALQGQLKRAPKPAEVIAAYDKRERARLQRLGIDPAAIVKTPAKKPANANTAPKPAPAPANTNGQSNGHKKMTPEEERKAILAEIESLKTSAQA